MITPKTDGVTAYPVFQVDSNSNEIINTVNSPELSASNFSGFGEQIAVGVIPSVQHTFHCEYHDTEHFTKTETGGGVVAFANSQVIVNSSSSASLAAYYGKKHIRYRAGQSIVLRFTTLFEATGAARTIKCGSMFAGLAGTATIDLGVQKSARNTKTGITTETAVLAIRNNRTFQGRLNHGRLKIVSISVATEGAGNNVVEIFARKNAVTGSPVWAEIQVGVSCTSKDTTGTVNTALVPYPTFTEARNSQVIYQVSAADPFYLDPEETLTISALSASSVAVTVCVNFIELKE